jgi:hypothetical protein
MINFVTIEKLENVWEGLDTRKETFIAACESGPYIACDNTSSDPQTERFKTLWGAIRWCTLNHLNADDIRHDENLQQTFTGPAGITQ